MGDQPDFHAATVRVLYRWRVAKEKRAEFSSWWHAGTLNIRASYHGALGSTLCQPAEDDDHLVAIARWKSESDLAQFWRDYKGDSPFPGAVLESAEVFAEIDNLVVDN